MGRYIALETALRNARCAVQYRNLGNRAAGALPLHPDLGGSAQYRARHLAIKPWRRFNTPVMAALRDFLKVDARLLQPGEKPFDVSKAL